MVDRPGNLFRKAGAVMRWSCRRRPAPCPVPDLAAVAAMGFAEGSRLATLDERRRCAAILQSPLADHNRASAEVLAFATDMDAAADVQRLDVGVSLIDKKTRTGPIAEHYTRAARDISERKSHQ